MIKMFLAGIFLIEFRLVRFCPKLNTWVYFATPLFSSDLFASQAGEKV